MDVKTTFLNGFIEDEMYIEQSQGFEVMERDSHVCLLRKALYGLKQAPRAWYLHIDAYLLRRGLRRVRQILTSTISFEVRIHSFTYCMLMICSLQERSFS
jgi:hypothetical protein